MKNTPTIIAHELGLDSNPFQTARPSDEVEVVNVRTPKGAVLCLPHGLHPLHCSHGSEPISKGTKYIIRTDLLYGDQESSK